jgi:hypothetical protein
MTDLAASMRLVRAADEDPLMLSLEQAERYCEHRHWSGASESPRCG